MDIIAALKAIFEADQLKTSLVDRVAWAGDAGFYQLIPIAVVLPSGEAQIKQLFHLSRKYQTPLVFRAAGTSLSGQSITNGILVDVSRFWQQATVLHQGKTVQVQPGIIGAKVNHLLSRYGKKIGPDPASINAAMMGGILANNASGMCCGVAHNSYHTLTGIRFMLPDGSVYDTRNPDDYARFENEQGTLCKVLTEQRQQLHANTGLYDKIRRKYRMKNTVGYSLNALVDYEQPLDIMAHLLIGSEGTLGFISEAELQTLPDLPCKSAAMLYFPGIFEACSAIEVLKASGAEALELMDRMALSSVEHLPGLPEFFNRLPQDAAALLCEYQAEKPQALEKLLQHGRLVCQSLPLLHEAIFTTTEKERAFYWKIRKGLFPSVGAVRKRGTTVILEDIAVPVPHLAHALLDLKKLFTEFGYEQAIIFGHAKEGNIHFVITQLLNEAKEVERYDRFMRKVVDLVLQKYDGALKAEHGTGRNMAPFVEAEWGGEAYAAMKAIKFAADPAGLLNPGVIINDDAEAHIRNLKQMPQVEAEVDKCIECGFCEHHCPSKEVTLTPRQRIQVRRHLKQMQQAGRQTEYRQLVKEYQYAGLDTCATDGLCQVDCPVSINTGELVKRLRKEQHGRVANALANMVSRNFGAAEAMVKLALKTGLLANRVMGNRFMEKFTGGLQKLMPAMPKWWSELQTPPNRLVHVPAQPQFVYFSACIQRMMGNDAGAGSVQQAMLAVSHKAGLQLLIPEKLPGHCCGQAFSSKGYTEAAHIRQRALIDALWQWTNGGKIPVVCDFTSCTYTLLQAGSQLDAPWQQKLQQIKLMDSLEFMAKELVPRLTPLAKKDRVVLHPGCAATKLLLTGSMQQVACHAAAEVVLPASAGCCGMAGDRGFLFPELTEGATRHELHEATALPADGYYASAKTCEMALTHFSGKPYQHLIYLLKDSCGA